MDSESQAPAFYISIREQLSQGDIVRGMPPAVLDHPLELCRPTGPPLQAKVQRLNAAEPAAFHKRDVETLHARGRKPGFGMVIWDDCQIDKMLNQGRDASKWYVAVAPVFPIDMFPEAQRAAVRERRRLAYFPLPAHEAIGIPESYVDFRLLWPVKQAAVAERIASLADETRAVLATQLFTFLTGRTFVERITCERCGASIDPRALLVDHFD